MNTQSSRFDKYYDAVVGSAAILGLAELTRRGAATITGSGPLDKNERQAWLDEGNRPYSLIVGGVAIPNRAFASAEGLLNATGETLDYLRYPNKKGDERSLSEEAITRVGRLIKQYPYAAGYGTIADLAQFGLPAAGADVATRLTPAGATLRQIGTSVDPQERTTDRGAGVPPLTEAVQRWQLGTGQREGLPVAQNILGEPKENPQQGAWAFFGRLGFPQDDPVIGLFQDARVFPADPRREITLDAEDGVKVTLSPDERRRWDAERGKVLRQAGAKLATNPRYAAAPLAVRQEVLNDLLDAAAEAANARVLASLDRADLRQRARASVGR